MNWEAIGASAELFGAIAVFASLVYLAVQVRYSAGVSRASAFQAIFDGLARHSNYMFGPENVGLMIRALRDYPDVAVEDRMRFDNLMTNLLNYLEASFHAADAQTLGDETMENWAWWFETKIFCYSGAVDWWQKDKFLYPSSIRAWVDDRIVKARDKPDYWGILEETGEEALIEGQSPNTS